MEEPGSGSGAGRSHSAPEARGIGLEGQPISKELWLHWRRRAERSYSTFKIRRGSGEEIPLVQGKRNPSKTVGFCKRASEGRHTETILTEN